MKMSVIITLVLLVILAGGFVAYKMYKKQQTAMVQTQMSPLPVTPSAMAPTATPTVAGLPASGNTNSSLDADTVDINAKLNSLNQDSTNIDTSLNDQQGNLTEN